MSFAKLKLKLINFYKISLKYQESEHNYNKKLPSEAQKIPSNVFIFENLQKKFLKQVLSKSETFTFLWGRHG